MTPAVPISTGRADLGARVIKIEPGSGDAARHYDGAVRGLAAHFVWLNHGKESAALDLTDPADLAGHEQLGARGRWRQVDTPVGPVPALLPPALARDWPAVAGRVPALGVDTEAIRAEVSRTRDRSR